ncbi:CAP domain-containing protein [Bailinhaonella thermotolerans]|nr:CAP domain-containing protein [Bailinhaonella thermotolerans]
MRRRPRGVAPRFRFGALACLAAGIALGLGIHGTGLTGHAAPPPPAAAADPAASASPYPSRGRAQARGSMAEEPTGAASGAASGPASPEAEAAEVVRLTNARRVRAGCRPLRVDARLGAAARAHSRDMATRGYFGHTSPGGVSPWRRMEKAGYHDGGAENIGRGYLTAAEAVAGWMSARTHRRNILDCRLRAVGVGVHHGPGGPWWTQDFGYS